MKFPNITDKDIAWVCQVLDIPSNTFFNQDSGDSRLKVLKNMTTIDVEACPGSGKTTLLVAKLAILAKEWEHTSYGMCILSHTNVARIEIEKKLGSSIEGQKLLQYPHFIGTIHGFINEYLALPWLRSNGYIIKVIDDEISLKMRWFNLSASTRRILEKNKYNHNILKIIDSDFNIRDLKWGKGKLGKSTEIYCEIVRSCKMIIKNGYFCHDEMLIWAKDLIVNHYDIINILRKRFPLLFIDEVQDNSSVQSMIIYEIFMTGDTPVIRQRFGDSNQAIYHNSDENNSSAIDIFPIDTIKTDILKSFRLSQEIANIAAPFGVAPVNLIGLRSADQKDKPNIFCQNTIFLFDNDDIHHVIDAYCQHILNLFSENELAIGDFTAIGAIHKPNKDHSHVPRSVNDYWNLYNNESTRDRPKPKTFLGYIVPHDDLKYQSSETYAAIQKIAEAFIRLLSISNPEFATLHKFKNNYMRELLKDKNNILIMYNELLAYLIHNANNLSRHEWETIIQPKIIKITEAISTKKISNFEEKNFLQWEDYMTSVNKHSQHNIYVYADGKKSVSIRIGSIHSVKGETHTSTLILETFYKAHNLKKLLPWLLRRKNGGFEENPEQLKRLRQHYVAMTRPTHLLCLALRQDDISDNDIRALAQLGWKIAKISGTSVNWQ